jgi:hypothetical protein
MGVIVNNSYISESLIFDKYGLFIVGSWGKLKHLIISLRDDWDSDEYAENFEELISRYKSWSTKTPTKITRGGRVGIREGRNLLTHGRRESASDVQSVTGSNQQ